MKKIDFLVIGDMVIDAFINLEDAHVHCKIDLAACELCVRFGDKIPYEDVVVVPAVGNSPNAAVGAARLGLRSALVTALGKDKNGKDCLRVLKQEKVITRFVNIDKNNPTNYHYVLRHGAERTILTKHAPFQYKSLKKLKNVSWLYLSSLGDHALSFHQEIEEFLQKNPETKLSFQPGTYQISLGYQKLKYFYERAEVFICNKEEANRILETQIEDIKELLKKTAALGPKIVCITDGTSGAYVYDGVTTFAIPMYPDPAPPVDRTGAGDAFSSTFTAALAMGKTIPEALAWGPINSMSVVQHIGAREGLLSKEKIQEYLAKAPADYKVKEI
jgi:ribokinase